MQGSKILIKIWLTPIRYDSSGGGCYREACGLGGSAEVLSQTGPLMWCDFGHLRGGCAVTRLDPNWDGAMMGPTAELAVMRGGTLNLYQNSQQWQPLLWKYKPNPHTLMNHTLPPLYCRSMAPKVGSWNCHGPTQDCKRPCSILRYCLIWGMVS